VIILNLREISHVCLIATIGLQPIQCAKQLTFTPNVKGRYKEITKEVTEGEWAYFVNRRFFSSARQIFKLVRSGLFYLDRDRLEDMVNQPVEYNVPTLNKHQDATEDFPREMCQYLATLALVRSNKEHALVLHTHPDSLLTERLIHIALQETGYVNTGYYRIKNGPVQRHELIDN